jgi:LPXTG-motif cell wall-anchored protein
MKRGLTTARTLLLVALLSLQVGGAQAAAPEVGIPSTSTTDGKFLGLAGIGLQTLTQQSKFFIGLSSTDTDFSVSIFDGDLGGTWDNHDPTNTVKTEFLLYADPTRSGDTTDKTPIVLKTSDQMTDNAWTDLYRGAVDTSARSYTGNYFYLVLVRWSDQSISANEFNSFKIKAAGQLAITPGQWAFVGAPVNMTSDPAFGTASNSYAGAWNWYVYVPPGTNRVNFTECDADARTASPAGSPPDDETDVRVKIPPDVRYSVLGPTGSLVIDQPVPSGNTACKTSSADVTGGGVYRWVWVGVDAHNLIFVNLSYETYPAPATPLPVGTASPTPTGTPVPASPTPTPTKTPTSTPKPTAPPSSSSGGGSAPAPTNVTSPLLAPLDLTPTVTPLSPSPAASPSRQPTPSPKNTPTVRSLPKTGEPASPAIGLSAAVALTAFGVLLYRRRR